MRDTIRTASRLGANSALIIGVVMILSIPFLLVVNIWEWKLIAVAMCLAINVANRQQTIAFDVFYTAGFSTLLWSIWFPFDLAIINGVSQFCCIHITGRTIHDWLARQLSG